MELKLILKSFLDSEGRLISFPSKRKMKQYSLIYLAEKLENGKIYTEKEINHVLNMWSCFDDCATLRRELYNNRFINRDSYGKGYWLEETQPTLKQLGIEE